MKRSKKITFGAMMAAMCTVCMLAAYFPYFTYAAPAVASLFIMVALIETDKKWAAAVYIVSALLTLLVAENESRFIFILFFGYYPILKALFEGKLKSVALWVTKMFSFNISVLLIYFATVFFSGITLGNFGEWGIYGAAVFVVAANIAFVLYDIALSRMAIFYINRFHKTVKNMLKF